MEDGRGAFKSFTGKSIGKGLEEGLGVVGRTILQWILKKNHYEELG